MGHDKTTISSRALYLGTPWRSPILWLGLVVLGWFTATAAWAEGTQNGVLTGTVIDAAETPLPGVEVRIAGDQVTRTALTELDGHFRFPALPVGLYRVTADLLGLTTERENVRIFIDKTTDVSLRLVPAASPSPVPGGEAEIEVSAVAPLLDRYETRLATRVGRDFLESLPLPRLYQSVALLVPGVAGGDVGNPNVSGALRGANLFLIDGVDTTDSTTGLFGLNLGYDTVDEVEVDVAAIPAAYGRASGAVINVVTATGGDRFQGRAQWLLTNPDWNADAEDEDPDLRPEIDAANHSAGGLDGTLALTAGGPLVSSRLWYFLGFEHGESSFGRPTIENDRWDEDATVETGTAKLSWQVDPRHTLIAQLTADDASVTIPPGFFGISRDENQAGSPSGRAVGVTENPLPGDTLALQRRRQDGEFIRLAWSGALGQNLSLEATVATQDRMLIREAETVSRLTGGAPHLAARPFSPATDPEILGIYNGLSDAGFTERGRDQANVTIDGYLRHRTGDHELRAGIDIQRTRSRSIAHPNGVPGTDPWSGRATVGQLFLDFDLREACTTNVLCVDFDSENRTFQPATLYNFWEREARGTDVDTLALFAEDTLSFRRFLISLGLRWEAVEGADEGGRKVADDHGLAPRIGLKVDPFGDGSVLLSASWGRYIEPFPQQFLDDFARPEALSGFSAYGWDLNNDPACEDADAGDVLSPCWVIFGFRPFFPVQFADPNADLERSAVDEWTLGIERRLSPTMSLRLTYVDRTWNDLWDDVLRVERDANGNAFAGATVESVDVARRSYRGIHMLLQRQFADRWQMLAAYTWGEAEGNLFRNDGFSFFADFRDVDDTNLVNRDGPAPYDRTHQLKVFASHHRDVGPFALTFGSALRYETGTPYEEVERAPLGVRFLSRRGAFRLDDHFQWDISVSAAWPFGNGRALEARFEVFNLTDEQERLSVSSVSGNDFERPQTIRDLQAPRNVRLTFGIRF